MSAVNECGKAEYPHLLCCRLFWLPQTTISSGPAETCIYRTEADDFITMPVLSCCWLRNKSQNTWLLQAKHEGHFWNFTNCICNVTHEPLLTASSGIKRWWCWCFVGDCAISVWLTFCVGLKMRTNLFAWVTSYSQTSRITYTNKRTYDLST